MTEPNRAARRAAKKPTPAKKSFAELRAAARLPEHVVPICMRGDLAAEHERLDAELRTLLDRPTDSLEGNGAAALADRVEAIEAEMREHTYEFVLRALPKSKFRALVAEHPPKPGAGGETPDVDRTLGVCRDTFFPELIRRVVVDPVLEDWDTFLADELTDRQYMDLEDAAWFVNRSEVSVPFSSAASRARRAIAPE